MSHNSDGAIALTKGVYTASKPGGRSAVLRRSFTLGVVVSATAAVLVIVYGVYGKFLNGYETIAIDDDENANVDNNQDFQQPVSKSLNTCPHVLLFSAIRHGSTWFVDNVERCAYSRDEFGNRVGTFGHLNRHAELWVKGQPGPLKDIPVNQVADYVFRNHSTKIFRFLWSSRLDDVQRILHDVAAFDPPVPIVLLTRDEQSVYQSWLRAKETETWTADTNGTKQNLNSTIWNSPEHVRKAKIYAERLKNYFADVAVYLSRNDFIFDQLDYDHIVQMRSIPLKNSQCVIHNCNFEAFPIASDL